MAILVCVMIVCGIFVLMIDHSDKKEREKLEQKENAEFKLNRTEYQFEKIFENEDCFLSEFLSWLTGEYVVSGTERDEFVSIKTGGFDRVSVSVRDRVRTVSIAGHYFSTENDEVCFPQIMVFPNSIVCRQDHPYVVVVADFANVFDDKFFEDRKFIYELRDGNPATKGFVLDQIDAMSLYAIQDYKEYYVKLCRKVEWIARDLESELARKGFLPKRWGRRVLAKVQRE